MFSHGVHKISFGKNIDLIIARGDNRGQVKFHLGTITMSKYDQNNELFTLAIFHFDENKPLPPAKICLALNDPYD